MNDIQSSSPNDLVDQVANLQRQVFILLLVLLVVSGTLLAYFRYEDYISHKDTDSIKQQATQLINAYNAENSQISQQGAEAFVNQLREFGGTHPDFAQQVLRKYGIPPMQPTNAQAKPAPAKK